MVIPNTEDIKEYFIFKDLPTLNINKKDSIIFYDDIHITKHEDGYFVYYKIVTKQRYYTGVTKYEYGEVELYFRRKKLDKIKNILYKNKENIIWYQVKKLFA